MYSNQLLVPRRSFVRLQSPDSNGAKSFLSNKNNDVIGNIISIKKKVIKIESLLKKDKKILDTENKNKKREEEKDKRLKKEEEREGKNRAKFFGKLAKKITPRTGILDWIKNFVSWLLIGSLFETFYNMIPTILNIVKFLEPLYKFFETFVGVLFEGLVTFIDLGYKAYDTFRGILKTLGGEPFAKAFDDFSSALNKLLNLGIILAMAYTFSPDIGPKQKPGVGQRARPGQGGRPKVTTSGGRGLGRPDFSKLNPFREAPKVTQGGTTPKFRMPGTGPKITGSGGGGGGFFSNFRMPKVSGTGLAKGAGTFGLGLLIDMAAGALIDKFIADPLSNSADSYRQSKIDEGLSSGKYTKQELINKIQSRLKEEQSKGIFTDNKKIEILTKDLEYVQKKESGGLVNFQAQNIKPQRSFKKVKLNKNLFNIPPEKTQPGKDIGGKEKAEMLYSDKKPKGFFSFWGGLFGGTKKEEDKATDEIEEIFNVEKDPVGTIKSLSTSMKRIPLLGGILGAALDLLLGQKPNKTTFTNFYAALGHLMTVVTGTEGYAGDILKSLFGFEEGGLITTSNDQSIDEENYTKLFKKTLGDPLEYRFTEAFGRVKKEVNKVESSEIRKRTKPEEYLTPTTDEISTLGSGGGSLKDLTDKDYDDLAYIVSGEAARGTDDEYGVAAAVLNRVASPVWPNTIMGVGNQPGQFEAVEKGTARRDPALAKKLKENQAKIADALNKLNGRDSFKGQSQLSNKGSGDIMFHPRGNFYHYRQQQRKTDPAPQSPDQSWKRLLGPSTGGSFSGPDQQDIPSDVPKGSVVQWLHGNPNRAGYRADHGGQANAHDHFSFKNRQAAVSAFLKLRQAGYKPYEFEGYTSVGKHSPTGGHYGPVGGKPTYSDKTDGTAFDIPWATYGSGPISQKDFDKSLKAAQIIGAAQGGGYINPTYKKINNTSGLNNYASYDDSSPMVLIQPVYIEKVISTSGGGLSFGSSGSSLTKSVGPKFQSLAR